MGDTNTYVIKCRQINKYNITNIIIDRHRTERQSSLNSLINSFIHSFINSWSRMSYSISLQEMAAYVVWLIGVWNLCLEELDIRVPPINSYHSCYVHWIVVLILIIIHNIFVLLGFAKSTYSCLHNVSAEAARTRMLELEVSVNK